MTSLHDVIGLPLDEALALCARAGFSPKVAYTGAYRDVSARTPRVIAVRENELIAACFLDGAPRAAGEDAHGNG